MTWKNHWRIPFLLLVTIVFFWNGMQGAFHFDDKLHLLENPDIHGGLAHLERLARYQFRPVLWFTYLVNYEFSGYSTFGWHAVNLGMHLLNVVLVFLLIKKTAGEKYNNLATVAALFFAIHPLQTESVTYISSRSELMAGNFFLGAMLSWMTFRRRSRDLRRFDVGTFVATIFLFFVGLFTKESLIVFPLMLVFWELYFGDVDFKDRRFWMPLAPFFALFFLWFVYRHFALQGTISNPNAPNIADASSYHWTEARVVVRYLWMHLFPVGQNIDPDIPTSKSLFEPWVLLSVAFHIAMVTLALFLRRKVALIGFFIFWFYIAIAPSSSFIPLEDVMAEHRVYLASVGVFVAFAWIIFRICEDLSPKWAWSVALAFAMVFGVMTFQRNRFYANGIYLWRDAASKSPNKARPHYNLGNAYFGENVFDKAIEHYSRAIEVNPKYLPPYFNRGNTYNKLGRYEEALRDYRGAYAIKPNFFQGHYNEGSVLSKLGRMEEAREAFRRVLSINPGYYDADRSIGATYFTEGRYEEAMVSFLQLVKKNPRSDGWLNIALCLVAMKRYEDAVPYLQRALEVQPQDARTWLTMAYVQSKVGAKAEFIDGYLNRAALLDPNLKENARYKELRGQVDGRLARRDR